MAVMSRTGSSECRVALTEHLCGDRPARLTFADSIGRSPRFSWLMQCPSVATAERRSPCHYLASGSDRAGALPGPVVALQRLLRPHWEGVPPKPAPWPSQSASRACSPAPCFCGLATAAGWNPAFAVLGLDSRCSPNRSNGKRSPTASGIQWMPGRCSPLHGDTLLRRQTRSENENAPLIAMRFSRFPTRYYVTTPTL